MTTPVNSWLDQYALPICSDKESPHSYKTPTETFPHFKVRSEHYVTRGHPRKGKKEPSAPPGCNLVGLFLVPAETKIPHICAHALNNKAAGFRVAIVFAVSVKEFAQHIIFLFERAPANDATLEPEHARKWQALWDQCTVPGNKLMADRMKILPYLSHGANFLMAKVVNNQPGQLAEALECQQFAGQGYVEVHVDIDAYKSASIFTKLAKAAVGMVYPHVAKLTIDLAFMMAALTEDELPERIIGAARLQKIDLNVRTNMLGSTTPSTSGPERRPAASPVATAPSPPRAAPSASSSDSSGVVREVSARKVSTDSPLGKLGRQLSESGQKLTAAVSNGGTLMAEVISDIEQRSRAASKEDVGVGAGAAPDKNGADSHP